MGNSWPWKLTGFHGMPSISFLPFHPRQLTRRLNSCMAVSLRCATSVEMQDEAARLEFHLVHATQHEANQPSRMPFDPYALRLLVPLRIPIPPAPLPPAPTILLIVLCRIRLQFLGVKCLSRFLLCLLWWWHFSYLTGCWWPWGRRWKSWQSVPLVALLVPQCPAEGLRICRLRDLSF